MPGMTAAGSLLQLNPSVGDIRLKRTWRLSFIPPHEQDSSDNNGSMRKRIVGSDAPRRAAGSDEGWLDLDRIATVEVTSEDPDFPIDQALGSNDGPGWRALGGGEQ